MKTTSIYLGIIATMFGNSIFANDMNNKQNHPESNPSETKSEPFSNSTKLKKPALELETDTIITWVSNYKKSIEEVIAEDNKITESEIENNTTSLGDDLLEAIIKEDHQITESNIINELFPLDLEILEKRITTF